MLRRPGTLCAATDDKSGDRRAVDDDVHRRSVSRKDGHHNLFHRCDLTERRLSCARRRWELLGNQGMRPAPTCGAAEPGC
jgi:hypothetical protein